MGNAFPKRFKYNPFDYAEFKTTTRGGSLRAFLIWKLELELKTPPSSEFDIPVNFMRDLIPQLELNQEEHHCALFELCKTKDTGTIYARLVKYPA
jgi:hypothetical protein